MKVSIRNKALIEYALAYLVIFISIIVLGYFCIDLPAEDLVIYTKENSIQNAIAIVKNNLLNFTGYVVTFIFWPVYIGSDIVTNALNVSVSLHAQGITLTLKHLIFHGIIEIPNSVVYTYMSYRAFRQVVKEKKLGIGEYVLYVKSNKKIYLGCVCFICIAGFIEGIWS